MLTVSHNFNYCHPRGQFWKADYPLRCDPASVSTRLVSLGVHAASPSEATREADALRHSSVLYNLAQREKKNVQSNENY